MRARPAARPTISMVFVRPAELDGLGLSSKQKAKLHERGALRYEPHQPGTLCPEVRPVVVNSISSVSFSALLTGRRPFGSPGWSWLNSLFAPWSHGAGGTPVQARRLSGLP